MPYTPLGSTHGRTMSTWHAIIAFGLAHTVGRRRAWHAIIALGRQTRSNDVGRGMSSLPLGSTDGRMASGVACHHRLWGAHKIERRRALHAIIAFGQHTWSDDVGRGMTSPPLDSTHVRQRWAWHDDITALGQHTRSATSGVTLHHRPWTAHTVGKVGRCMTSPSLDSTHGRQHRAWHDDITSLGQNTLSATSSVA